MNLATFFQLPDAWYELRRGDWVAWNRSKIVPPSYTPVVLGQVLRIAKDKTWADIRYRIPEHERGELAVAWSITHRTQRVKTLYLRKTDAPQE